MILNKKIKNCIIPALATTLILSGCGKKVEEATEVKETVTTEATTQVTTEDFTIEEIIIEPEVVKDTMYENNQEFCDLYGITEEEIENIGKVLNSDTATLTRKDVTDVCDNINEILLPQYLIDTLGHIHNEELGYVTIEGQFDLLNAPSLSQYATNSDTKAIVETYETLRNKVIADINATNKVSEETKEELKAAVIKMEEEYVETVSDMNLDTTNEGQILLENYAKKKLIDLTVNAACVSRLESEKIGTLILIPETYEEKEIYAIAMTNGIEALTDEQKEVYNRLSLEKIDEKYIDGICTSQEQLKENAKKDYTKQELENYKQYLIAQKEEAKYYTYSL